MIFLKKHWSVSILIIIAIGTIIYISLPSTKPTQLVDNQQAPVYARTIKKHGNNGYTGVKALLKEVQEQELDRLRALGDSANPSDIRDIDFYERGGLIGSTPEVMGLSEDAVKSIRDNLHQIETRGYYRVDRVTDLNQTANIAQKLKTIFKASGASNFHDSLGDMNDYLSFSSTEIDNSLFSYAERLASQTYGAVNSGRWSAIKHIFDVPELGTVRLNEMQAGPGGHTVHVLAEQLNEQVNGLPAKYAVEVAADGNELTSLVWVNGNNMYEMYMQRNAGTDKEAKAYFFELARSLPDPSTDK